MAHPIPFDPWKSIPVFPAKIPCSVREGISLQDIEFASNLPIKFPFSFPVSRDFGAETGSDLTASSAIK
jgi:hypothetical protein